MKNKPRLHTFHVFLKRHGERVLRAYRYSENTETGRTIFHRSADGSDEETFFQTDEIVGIERDISEQEITAGSVSIDEFQQLIDSLPLAGEANAEMLPPSDVKPRER